MRDTLSQESAVMSLLNVCFHKVEHYESGRLIASMPAEALRPASRPGENENNSNNNTSGGPDSGRSYLVLFLPSRR